MPAWECIVTRDCFPIAGTLSLVRSLLLSPWCDRFFWLEAGVDYPGPIFLSVLLLSYLFPNVLSATYEEGHPHVLFCGRSPNPGPYPLLPQYRSTAGSTSRDHASIPPRSDWACSNP